jgi:O-antigen ligase
MIWLLGGYVWLFVHRPFEFWLWLGDLQVERGYMLLMLGVWLVQPDKGLASNRLHAALAFFVGVMGLCWALSPFRDQAVDVIETVAKVAVFYLLVVTTVRDEKQLGLLLRLYLCAIGVYLLHSLWEYKCGRHVYRMGIARLGGVDLTYSDPNSFAATLVYALPLTLPLWYELKGLSKGLLALGTAVAAGAVLLTGSRAGFVGLCAVFFIFFLVSPHRKLLFGVSAVGAVVALAALPDFLQDRILTIFDSSYGPQNAQQSASSRLEFLKRAAEVWALSPIIGHGPASFASLNKGMNAHNLYGQMLAEVGLLGIAAFLIMLWCFWRNAREVTRLTRGRARGLPFQLGRAVSLSVVLLLLLGWSGHSLYRYNWMWLAAFQACAVHCARLRAAARAPAWAPTPARLPSLVGPRRATLRPGGVA